MENINQLLNQYNSIRETISNANDEGLKSDLQEQLNSVNSKIKVLLEHELANGNTSKELIELCSRFDVVSDLDKIFDEKKTTDIETLDLDEEENAVNKEQADENKPLYTLASAKITSLVTGEEIDLSKLTRIEKIKAIYEHTGVEVNIQDPEIVELCNQRFKEFLRVCPKEKYIAQYGENWQEIVEQLYKSTYLSTTHACIANAFNEVDRKRHEEQKKMEQETANLKEQNTKMEEEIAEIDNLIGKTKEAITENEEKTVAPEVSKQSSDSINILKYYDDIVSHAETANIEEVRELMEHYVENPIVEQNSTYSPFTDPLAAERLNNRYKDLTGVNHPMYDKHQLNVVNAILSRQDGSNQAYYELLNGIKEDIQSAKTSDEATFGQR